MQKISSMGGCGGCGYMGRDRGAPGQFLGFFGEEHVGEQHTGIPHADKGDTILEENPVALSEVCLLDPGPRQGSENRGLGSWKLWFASMGTVGNYFGLARVSTCCVGPCFGLI